MIFGLFGGDKMRVAELIAASRSGDTDKISELLANGADVNAPEPESGDTPLLAAIDKSQWAAARLLLKSRPDLSLQDKNGNSPLYIAVSRGDAALPIVDSLLDVGASPDLGPSQGENAGATPVHITCATGANGCLESLLRHGASATKQLPDGSSPMHTAAIGGDSTTIELLSNSGGNTGQRNKDDRTPLHNCGIAGNANVATALIQLGAQVDALDKNGWTPLMQATMKNHVAVAKVLLDHGANPSIIVTNENTPLFPLYLAVMYGFDDLISLLIDKGANITAKVEGSPPLVDVAKLKGHESAAKILASALKVQRDKANEGKNADKLWKDIVASINSHQTDEVRHLTNSKHFSKLGLDAQLLVHSVLGDVEKIDSVIALGAKPGVIFDGIFDGLHSLYAAVALSGNAAAVQFLLKANAAPDCLRADGASSLAVAAIDGNVGFVKILLAAGANPNIQLKNGATPLFLAANNNHKSVVDLLLDAGADAEAKLTTNGMTAFGAAVNRLHMDLALHLLNRGAKPDFGNAETLGLAVAEHGSLELILAIEKNGGTVVRSDQLSRVAFVGSRNKDCEVMDHLFNHGADLTQENDCQYTPLILSVLRGHTKLVQRYVQRGDDLNARDADNETALSLAIEKNQHEMISILRAHGAQTVDYPGLSEEESMLKAAEEGNLGTILNLYDAGVSVNIQNDEGFSPIMLATKAGHLGVLRSLFHIGADINHRNEQGQSATAIASLMEDSNLLITMKEFAADDAMPEFMKSIKLKLGGIHDIGDMMLGRKSRPGKEDIPYDTASDDEHEGSDDDEDSEVQDEADASEPNAQEILEKLSQLEDLLAKPNIAAKFEDSMIDKIIEDIRMIQAEGPSDDFAKQVGRLFGLLENLLSEPEEVQLPPLLQAASEGDFKEVKRLLKSGLDANSALPDGTTALMKAVEGEHANVISELLKCGANVNQQRVDHISSLLLACLVGNEGIVKVLVANGANINESYALASAQGEVGNNTVLIVAAQRASLSMCKLLVKLGANVNAVSGVGYSPLMASLANGISEDIALYFLQQGANPDPDVESKVEFSTSTTPLVLAASNGFSRVVKELVQRKAAIDKADGDGKTALKMAALGGHEVVVNFLIKAGAHVDAMDNEGWTALMNVAGKGNLEIAKVLIKAGADVNARSHTGVTPLIQAIGKHDDASDEEIDSSEMIKLLLKQGANPNVDREGTSLLMGAEENDDVELVKLLKKYGASADISMAAIASSEGDLDPDGSHQSSGSISASKSLIYAVGQVDVSRVKELVGHGADINYQDSSGNTALSLAVSAMADASISRRNRRDLNEISDFLINQGANLNLEGCDPGPLGMAAFVGDLHLVSAMLKRGAQTEAMLLGQVTPLLAAISNGHEDCALALIRVGASVTFKFAKKLTVLHAAAESNLLKVVEAVLEKCPSLIDEATENLYTPLMSAAIAGNADVVKVLMRHQANRSCVDSNGLTAAAHATANGHAQIAESLNQ